MSVQTQQRPPTLAESETIARTERKDNWWASPLGFALLFGTFVVWATFRTFQNNYYHVDHYLSPFYAPTIETGWVFYGYHLSPALLILPFPLSFRLTCYYYRKAIYRSYLADPVACAVREPKPLEKARFGRYSGERAFPFIAMNFHRFAFYIAAVFMVLLWYDALLSFLHTGADGKIHFGIGVGTLIFLANVILLTAYTFSCHSWRHLIGGGADCYSCSALNKTRYGLWTKVSFLNEKHGIYAMASLCSVLVTDIYVFLLATHTITDLRILF
jgi:hypothetical protein